MITSLRLVNFKNFADETLRVGPFTLLVGANASGKSNIRDAFRFLHGIGRGYTLAEIMGGKYGGGNQIEWEPIRGAPNEVIRFGRLSPLRRGEFSVHLGMDLGGEKSFYSITVGFNQRSPDGFRVREEELRTESELIYTTDRNRRGTGLVLLTGHESARPIMFSRAQPALTQFLRPRFARPWYPQDSELAVHPVLESMRFLEWAPERMREPAVPGAATLGDTGQNLPSVLEAICAESDRKEVLTAWLRELTPMDVRDLIFRRDPSGRVHLQIVEKNRRIVSAYSASDGTLRFLGMLAVLLGMGPAGFYFFEEIDNGIHPARLSLLLELIEQQTAKGGVQVVATTHSPGLLDMVNDTTFEDTSVVYRDENSEDAVIRPVADLPKARELRKSQGLGRLHAAGWMENMLAFAEADNDDGEDSQ